MKKWVYTSETFKGTLVFAVIAILIFVLPDIIYYFKPVEKITIEYLPKKEQEAIDQLKRTKSIGFNYHPKSKKYKSPPSKFDPNEYTLNQWMALGLTQKQANVILKFTKYRLKNNDDLKRIFVINEELFNLIKDSTVYSSSSKENFPIEKREGLPQGKEKRININTASKEELMSVPGIGAFYADNIIKQRNKLGGLYHFNQLMELYKMDEEKLNKWKNFLEIDPSDIQKININTCSVEDLKKHPYFSWNLANSVVKLREQKGVYQKVEDIKKSALMNDALFEKVKHYLEVN